MKLEFWRSMHYSKLICFTTYLAKMPFRNSFSTEKLEKRASANQSATTQSPTQSGILFTLSQTTGNGQVTQTAFDIFCTAKN